MAPTPQTDGERVLREALKDMAERVPANDPEPAYATEKLRRAHAAHNRCRVLPLALAAALLLAGCGPLPAGEDPAASRPAPASNHGCVEHDGLPDARCTPGAIRAGVTLATICSYSYSRGVRPPESYTEPLKLA